MKVTTHNKGERKILTHRQIRTLNQTIQKKTDTSPELRKARCDITRAQDLPKQR